MKNALTPTQGTAAVSEPWRAALRTFDADLQRRGAAERTRKAYGTDAAELAAWATANGLDPDQVDYKALRRWAARLSQRAPPRARWRASSRRPAASSAACSSTARSRPTRPTCCRRRSCRRRCPKTLKPQDVAAPAGEDPGLDAARAARSRAVRARLQQRAAGRGARRSRRQPASTSTQEQVRVEGKGCQDPLRARRRARAAQSIATYLERARPALQSADPDPALFLSKSGRRLSTSDVRRRLRVWARHAAHADRRAPARPAALLRHPPAGRAART